MAKRFVRLTSGDIAELLVPRRDRSTPLRFAQDDLAKSVFHLRCLVAKNSSVNQSATTPLLRTTWLGRMEFSRALELQEEIVRKKHRDAAAPNELLLLEHEAVYTIGRTPDQSSLRCATHLPHPLFPINRGGQATFHGPGQLVGYFLLDLRRYSQDLHRYLRWLETLLIELLADFEINATMRAGFTGVWVEQRKIASIGIGVRHWITMHGFALNVSGDLSPFAAITPCGIAGLTMTSIEKETGEVHVLESVAQRAASLAQARVTNLLGSTGCPPVGADCQPART